MSAKSPPPAVFARLLRAGRLESLHRGHLLALRGDEVVASAGDPRHLVFVRSAVKPIQALTGITSGAVDRFGIDERGLAVACASHMARDEHLAAVHGILAAAEVPEEALGCGGHPSFDLEVARRQVVPPSGPPAIWSNCSGKHAMMLASARALGAPLDGYLAPDHPVQRSILADLTMLSGVAPDDLVVAVDGCGAPAPALPLDAFARLFASLLRARNEPSHPRHEAARRVIAAMAAHPDLIAGPGRFDSDLMRAAEGRVVTKVGAEGVHIALVPATGDVIALKVEDGSDRGYRGLVIAMLERFGALEASAADGLRARHADPAIRNWRGVEVGRLEVELPTFARSAPAAVRRR